MVGIYVVTEILSLNIFTLKNLGDNLRVFTIQSFQLCYRFEIFHVGLKFFIIKCQENYLSVNQV